MADLGIGKRMAALARLYASVSEDELEAALDRREAEYAAGGRRRPLKDFLPDRRANSRHERESRANIARIISTAQRIVKAHEFDTSEDGSRLRHMAVQTVELWAQMRSMPRQS